MNSPTANSALITFAIYLLVVFFLAWLSSRVRKKREFVNEYFLGSRNLGVWAFALTFAATNASGGSFMGFPSLIYTHGWVLALWIASFMMVPLVTTTLLAKRLNHVARKAGAVTVPDVLRARFESPTVGLIATSLLTFFMFFYLLAQFKAGSEILVTLLDDTQIFQSAVSIVGNWTDKMALLGNTPPSYLLCLLVFSSTVIVYTAYGGFRAVVWTDVMQGIVMVVGVIIMLFLVLHQLGGLKNATMEVAKMIPPDHGKAIFKISTPLHRDLIINKGEWLELTNEYGDTELMRSGESAVIHMGETHSEVIPVLIINTPEEKSRIQPRKMDVEMQFEMIDRIQYESGAGEVGVYVSAPGPDPNNEVGFLSMGMALSFFVFWAFSGSGQPASMVRQMAFQNSSVLKRSIIMISVYYAAIYFPLVIIFCCARVLLPGMEIESDRVMPELAQYLSISAGSPWLAGLIMAAPFAAIMSSVDSFLLMVSSGLVRDIYQRNINPDVTQRRLKILTFTVTAMVGIAAFFAILDPPQYLQNLIIFASSGLAGSFLVPMALALYWVRMNKAGVIAGMLGGCGTHLLLYIVGYSLEGRFTVYQFLGVQPFIWDLVGSAIFAITFCLLTNPPEARVVRKWFY